MTAEDELSSKIDLKKFFEASVGALQNGNQASHTNRALVRRAGTEPTLRSRAVTDAARALTALWRMQAPRKA